MKKLSFRPRSTSCTSAKSVTGTTSGKSRRESFSIRKASCVFSDLAHNSSKDDSLIDDGQLQGRVKVLTSIKNPSRCVTVNYRPHDGRFYAVGLANGTINVYSSKTDNILYTLNNEDNDLLYSDISTTCVRFRPCSIENQNESNAQSLLSTKNKRTSQRKLSRAISLSDSEYFLPPIVSNSPRSSFSQRRRKSSYCALGHNVELTSYNYACDTPIQSNLITATFTDGSVKTFNFMVEQCVREVKENREVLTMDYNPSGDVFATGGDNGCLLVYDAETGSLKCSYEPPFDFDRKLLRTYSIAFHPTSEAEFVCGGWNRKIQFLDVRVPNLLASEIPGPKMCGESLSFHSSGKEFCAAAWGKDEGVILYDYAMRRPLESINRRDSLLDSTSIKTTKSKREQPYPSPFLYSARYFMENYIAVTGAFPGSIAVVERTLNLNKKPTASISNLPTNVFSLDTYKSKVAFILRDEVCCTEIFI